MDWTEQKTLTNGATGKLTQLCAVRLQMDLETRQVTLFIYDLVDQFPGEPMRGGLRLGQEIDSQVIPQIPEVVRNQIKRFGPTIARMVGYPPLMDLINSFCLVEDKLKGGSDEIKKLSEL